VSAATVIETPGNETVPPPYTRLRVVELATDPAGELTGLQLVHLGADVIKVEPPGGAPSRHVGPFAGDVPDPEGSVAFWYYNGGKRSVELDLDRQDDRAAFDRLVAAADVLVITLQPRDLRRLGIDLDVYVAAHPSLIVVSITPFGLTGPWSDYLASDLVALATSGLLITSGYDDHSTPPIRPGGDQAYHTAASFAHIAVLLALHQRCSSGAGALLDLSIQEAAGVTVELANPYWFYPRGLVQRQTCRHAQPVPTQPAIFKCGDGRWVYFALILADEKPWRALVEWLDSEHLAADLTDPVYDDLVHRQVNFHHVQGVVEAFFLLHDSAYVYHEGQRRGLPIGVLNAPEDLYDDEHLRARDYFVDVEQPAFGPMPKPVAAYRFSAIDTVVPQPAPRLGEHDDLADGGGAPAP
jgi:crotonobetainyl-CoA:carnitine CoA-transferase CaiB-like acyl-CoA transferase